MPGYNELTGEQLAPSPAICPWCDSDTCHPLEWVEVKTNLWLCTLVCGNCEHEHDASYHVDECEKFDDWLSECLATIAKNYREFSAFNMREWSNNFLTALNADAILPEDF